MFVGATIIGSVVGLTIWVPVRLNLYRITGNGIGDENTTCTFKGNVPIKN
jgi:hypothetical protein